MNAIKKLSRGLVRFADCGHIEGAAHSCDYVEWREALIPLAESFANRRYPEPVEASREDMWRWSLKWDACFHREMTRLTSDPFVRLGAGQTVLS